MESNHRLFAVVTGASSGIGYELARVFAKNGYDLLVTSGSDGRKKQPVISAASEQRCRVCKPISQRTKGWRSSGRRFSSGAPDRRHCYQCRSRGWRKIRRD